MKRALACALSLSLLAGCAARSPAPVIDRLPSRSATKPAPSPAPAQQAGDGYYTVKRGDTLYSIAFDHGADYREVAQWNFIDDPSKLRVGQVLRVKPPEERVATGIQ